MAESKKYSKMLEEVETIISDISTSEVDLDKMVEKVEKGYALIKQMRDRLGETKEKIEVLRSEFGSQNP